MRLRWLALCFAPWLTWRSLLAGLLLLLLLPLAVRGQIVRAPPPTDADWRHAARECTAVVRGYFLEEFGSPSDGAVAVKRFALIDAYKGDRDAPFGSTVEVLASTQFYDHGEEPLADVVSEGDERVMFLGRPIRDKRLDGLELYSHTDRRTIGRFDPAGRYEVCRASARFYPVLKLDAEHRKLTEHVVEQVRERNVPLPTPSPTAASPDSRPTSHADRTARDVPAR